MIVVESGIGFRQIFRSSEANIQLIFFLPCLSGSPDLFNEKLVMLT